MADCKWQRQQYCNQGQIKDVFKGSSQITWTNLVPQASPTPFKKEETPNDNHYKDWTIKFKCGSESLESKSTIVYRVNISIYNAWKLIKAAPNIIMQRTYFQRGKDSNDMLTICI